MVKRDTEPLKQAEVRFKRSYQELEETQAQIERLAGWVEARYHWTDVFSELRRVLVLVEEAGRRKFGVEVGIWVEDFRSLDSGYAGLFDPMNRYGGMPGMPGMPGAYGEEAMYGEGGYGAPGGMSPYGEEFGARYGAPTDPYGAPAMDPYGAPPMDPYGAPPMDPYGAPPMDPYGAPAMDPYGEPGMAADPYGMPPGAAPGMDPYGGYGEYGEGGMAMDPYGMGGGGAIDPMTGMPMGGGGQPMIDPMTGQPMIDPMTGMPMTSPAAGGGGASKGPKITLICRAVSLTAINSAANTDLAFALENALRGSELFDPKGTSLQGQIGADEPDGTYTFGVNLVLKNPLEL